MQKNISKQMGLGVLALLRWYIIHSFACRYLTYKEFTAIPSVSLSRYVCLQIKPIVKNMIVLKYRTINNVLAQSRSYIT